MRIDLVSDTHGLVRPEMLAELEGCDAIIHAGDIGGAHVLEQLAAIAPVHAVRGNVDEPDYLRRSRRNRLDPDWAAHLPITLDLVFEGVSVHVIHDVAQLGDVSADVVVVGHSHIPRIDEHPTRLLVNPGSTGPRRFSLPISMAHLRIDGGKAHAEFTELAG